MFCHQHIQQLYRRPMLYCRRWLTFRYESSKEYNIIMEYENRPMAFVAMKFEDDHWRDNKILNY